MAFEPRQTSVAAKSRRLGGWLLAAIEARLEAEREQMPLWVPVALGGGIAAWFILHNRLEWLAFCCAAVSLASAAMLLPSGGRLRRLLAMGGVLACAGCLLIWAKAGIWGMPPLPRAQFVEMTGEVQGVSAVPAEQMSRVLIRPIDAPGLPPLVRVNMAEADVPQAMGRGAVVRFRARLMPPAAAS
ncbi:MAG TPA: hypothetical protein VJM09_16110, partial [Sphingobium sp.]|nr:hypothetical protein [Sphingobium sp.]